MSIMPNAKRALAIAAAAATLFSMAACGSSNAAGNKSDSSSAASSGKIEVVASINQWGSVAEDLGGSNVEVTN
ncbi:MAG: ABC transporter substrate-binding protein, partial [Bifidobacterium breve]|nr:ABC transporter substrate-binding protein [Bifidobacterium breve]